MAVLGVVAAALLALPGIASAATVKADFNGDGRSDLAVGAAAEDIGSVNAGAVNVIYGSASGLDGEREPGVLPEHERDPGPKRGRGPVRLSPSGRVGAGSALR